MYKVELTQNDVINLIQALNTISVKGKEQMIAAIVLIDKLEKVLQSKPEGE